MGITIASYAYIGFEVSKNDFWDTVPAKTATCDKGHESTGAPFCAQDGTKFVHRPGRTASAKFQALAKFFSWKTENGFEAIYDELLEDAAGEGTHERICAVDRRVPTDTPTLALVRPVVKILGWERRSSQTQALSLEDLNPVFEHLEHARQAAGFEKPTRLFLSLYVS